MKTDEWEKVEGNRRLAVERTVNNKKKDANWCVNTPEHL